MIFFDQYIDFTINELYEIEKNYSFNNVILSSVLLSDKTLEKYLKLHYNFIKFSDTTPIPIKNHYQTPQTLGSDRLACAVAAHHLFPTTDCLIIQMGSCITYDFINKKGEFLGGSISPGLIMRYKALNTFTQRLPYLYYHTTEGFMGCTTDESIHLGVRNGIIHECNGIINEYKTRFDNLKVLLTGGDSTIFKNAFQNEIITIPNLVITGLSLILKYNAENKN